MPLPTTGSISLQGHSRPGEGVTTKPKLAMIVRMTEETLDALQNLSMEDRMEFEFGDRPGIHIQETFFPMRYNKEKENHELFIRTTTAVRPNAPLKLNANVVGKFNVERDLSEKLSKQIQEASAAAAKQKTERRVIMLDNPLTTTGKTPSVKRKAPPKATATKVMTVKNVTAPSTNTSAQQPVASSSSLSQEQVLQLRQRLVHYLALGTATAPDILKNVGGIETDWDVRRKIIEILNEVAEEVRTGRKGTSSASQDTKWQLKQKFWLEVRPYAYPDYTDNVRTTVARTARTWLSSMKIPETDPAWNHVKFRTNGSSGPNGSSATGQARAMNGTSSAAAKEKAKTKSKAKGLDIKAKSEAVRPVIQAPPSLARTAGVGNAANVSTNGWNGKVPELDIEREEGEISQSNTPPRAVNSLPAAASAPRRPPGSRQTLAPPSATPQLPARPTTPQPTPSPSHPSTNSLPPPKRAGPVDARGPRRSLPEPSERARAAPPIPPPAPVEKKPAVIVTKAIPAAGSPSGTPSSTAAKERAAREREREALKKEKEKERESDRESLRARDRERERERERDIVKRERDRESDLESARAVKHERERESDLDELRERRRELKREKIREARERDREVEREEALLEVQRKERVREKKEAAIRAEATERIERERAERKRAKEAAASAATSSKAGTKRKQPEYSDDSDSSDWGIEERKPKKSSMATSSSAKPKRPKDDVPVKAPSTVRVKRESTPPLKRVKRELSPPPPPPPKKATTTKSSGVSVVSSRETSQSLKTKVKGRDHDRDRERERIRDRDRDRERNSRGREREREQEQELERDWSARVSNGSNGASRKRPPPDYTSSSEEEEDVKPLKKVASKMSRKPLVDSPHASQTPPISAARPRPSHTRPAASPQPPPTPSDHDSLRTRYSNTYIAYIDVFQKLCSQKAKISKMLHRRSGSVSAESDADVDMLSPEELESLKSQHKRLHEELQSIARFYAQ